MIQYRTCQKIIARAIAIAFCLAILACAHKFPRPDNRDSEANNTLAKERFKQTFLKHGGGNINQLNDVNLSIDGDWKFLITRIQPLVTDHKYRQTSQERILPNKGIYSAFYQGPAGTKKVVRTPKFTRVFYNGEETKNQDNLNATALTSDAFFIFLLGPLGMQDCADKVQLLSDKIEHGQRYYRLYCEKNPGIGNSPKDELVLWIDSNTMLAYRIQITLEVFKTTRGAHVDVTFLNFIEREGFIFPNVFEERVLAPINIHAHDWWLTGLDINRGLHLNQLDVSEFSGDASAPAKNLSEQEIALQNKVRDKKL